MPFAPQPAQTEESDKTVCICKLYLRMEFLWSDYLK